MPANARQGPRLFGNPIRKLKCAARTPIGTGT